MADAAAPEAPALVPLAEARAHVGQGRCICGSGVFTQVSADAPLKCVSCWRVRRKPAEGPPKLAFRCGCGASFFLVTLTSIECGACAAAIAFNDLFDTVAGKRGGAPP